MKVAVFGVKGQLGSDILRVLQDQEHDPIGIRHEVADVADPNAVTQILDQVRPHAVVNCAAFHKVDDCESDPGTAFRVNAVGALNIARTCADLRVTCLHISTDYVFEGEKAGPYVESDTPLPINAYGVSKLSGEMLLRQACDDWVIVRVASLFGKAGSSGKGGNFIESILRKAQSGEPLQVVSDTSMSPTYTLDAARAIEELLVGDARGIFHVTNHGSCSWFALASEALKLVGFKVKVEPVPSTSFEAAAERPKNSALSSEALPRDAAQHLRPWREALEAYLLEKGHINDPTRRLIAH